MTKEEYLETARMPENWVLANAFKRLILEPEIYKHMDHHLEPDKVREWKVIGNGGILCTVEITPNDMNWVGEQLLKESK